MDLDNRLKTIEKSISMNPDLFREKVNFDNMTDEALDAFLLNAVKEEVNTIKNICVYHNISIKDREGFETGLRLYAEKYCVDEVREFYSEDYINLLGKVFETAKDKLM